MNHNRQNHLQQFGNLFWDGPLQLADAQASLAIANSDISEKLGRWKQHLREAEAFSSLSAECARLTSRLSELNKAVDLSSAKQDAARESMDVKHRALHISNYYTQILRVMFGESARGSIEIDGNGLHPKPAKKLTPGGRALGAMATVVAFDLACVMASVAGIGNHPRFLLHDSPREGEMEMPLFKRIFEAASVLESCFDGAEPSFQYIVTTTKVPPSFSRDNESHVCVTLHGRSDEGRLMTRTF